MSNCLFIACPNGKIYDTENRFKDVTSTEVVERYEPNNFLTTELKVGFKSSPKYIQLVNRYLNMLEFEVKELSKRNQIIEKKYNEAKRYSSNNLKYSK